MKHFKLFKNIFAMAFFLTALWLLFTWSNVGIFSLHTNDPRSIPVMVKNKLCYVKHMDDRIRVGNSSLQMIYYVTPTYPRPEQVPELTRLAHTLMHVPRLHWIVADDQPLCSERVLRILKSTGLPFTHISSPKPFIYKSSNFPRGVSNRRAALDWLHENASKGVLYFGDDDNTVDLQLFEEIRNTKKVSMFPVGLIGDYGVSSPVVKEGKIYHHSMASPRTKRATWSEESLNATVNTVGKCGRQSTYNAAAQHGIPKRTIRNHLLSGVLHMKIERNAIFTPTQEKDFVNHIIQFSEIVIPLTPKMFYF